MQTGITPVTGAQPLYTVAREVRAWSHSVSLLWMISRINHGSAVTWRHTGISGWCLRRKTSFQSSCNTFTTHQARIWSPCRILRIFSRVLPVPRMTDRLQFHRHSYPLHRCDPAHRRRQVQVTHPVSPDHDRRPLDGSLNVRGDPVPQPGCAGDIRRIPECMRQREVILCHHHGQAPCRCGDTPVIITKKQPLS